MYHGFRVEMTDGSFLESYFAEPKVYNIALLDKDRKHITVLKGAIYSGPLEAKPLEYASTLHNPVILEKQPNQASPLSIGQWKTDRNIKVVITTRDGDFWVGHLEGNSVVTMLYDSNGNFASGFDAGKLMKCRRGDEKW